MGVNLSLNSWGRVFNYEHQIENILSIKSLLPIVAGKSILPYGNGRSYGDSCLNHAGVVIKTQALDHLIQFDPATGVIRCEAGVLFAEILRLVVPQGWFLPVTPGTRFVTVGGAIANDVHGKNHHVSGTMGCHIRQFELLRSDGQRLLCSQTEHADYFSATIGGLGLTGLITWAEIQLRRIGNPSIDVESIRFESLGEFFALCDASDLDYEYTVAWIDCAGQGKRLGRGLFMRGNHAPLGAPAAKHLSNVKTFPLTPPISLINALTLKAFNTLYYNKQLAKQVRQIQHYEPFFYPLDGLLQWNRMYGPNGFYQYQCVIPKVSSEEAAEALLKEIAESGMGSFLAVLKVCGAVKSPGLLSFPMPGVSLALDFPNCGEPLERLFLRLDAIVSSAGGRLYPAKDGRMPPKLFQRGYPALTQFSPFIDPHFSSSFWRRVTEQV